MSDKREDYSNLNHLTPEQKRLRTTFYRMNGGHTQELFDDLFGVVLLDKENKFSQVPIAQLIDANEVKRLCKEYADSPIARELQAVQENFLERQAMGWEFKKNVLGDLELEIPYSEIEAILRSTNGEKLLPEHSSIIGSCAQELGTTYSWIKSHFDFLLTSLTVYGKSITDSPILRTTEKGLEALKHLEKDLDFLETFATDFISFEKLAKETLRANGIPAESPDEDAYKKMYTRSDYEIEDVDFSQQEEVPRDPECLLALLFHNHYNQLLFLLYFLRGRLSPEDIVLSSFKKIGEQLEGLPPDMKEKIGFSDIDVFLVQKTACAESVTEMTSLLEKFLLVA